MDKIDKVRMVTLMTMLYSLPRINVNNPPNPDKNIVNPPQSEESKQYYLKRAEEKRLRKRLKLKSKEG